MKHAMLEKSTKEQIEVAREAAEWLIDAVACATQNRTFLRGEPECDVIATQAIIDNGIIACLRAMHKLEETQ